jgi:predicted RNA binding protein YcfA (HicA-like mRNA interferase family)
MPISGKEAAKILQKNGFIFARQRGSHTAWVNTAGLRKLTVIVPMHKELKKSTIRSIAKQADMDTKGFGL